MSAPPDTDAQLRPCPHCAAPMPADSVACARCGALTAGASSASEGAFLPENTGSFALRPAGPDPLVGLVVAERYRIVEPIGRGGMGVVYKVEHVRIGKLMAMKLLAGELSRDPGIVGRFKREALTASRLSHPNTVQVFDFGASDGLTYLVMELLPGADLGRVLRAGGPLRFDRLAGIIAQVCGSLAEAHGAGIVHRDLKPENVFLVAGREGRDMVKVLDFGLAKLREAPELNELTSAGAIVGTPYYMSPEQIRGEPVDARADVYALGALMYRALTGVAPFVSASPMAVFTKHLTEAPVAPHERAPEAGISPAASAIVLRALAKERAARYPNVETLRRAVLEEAARSDATPASSTRDVAPRGAPHLSEVASRIAPGEVVATRDEVEAYEHKLRRQRTAARVVGVAALVAAAVLAQRAWARATAPVAFDGREREPNDQPGDATSLPFGSTVRGQIGRRVDATHSDRDFFAVDVQAGPGGTARVVRLTATALPNFATCTLLYRAGLDAPLGTFCAGRAARDLVIEALRLEPGRYFLAQLQDRDGYGAPPHPVHENVSDSYAITIGAAPAAAAEEPAREVEPNDDRAHSIQLAPGSTVSGVLAWMRDRDVVCATGAGQARFVVRDAEKRPRDAGAVLAVVATTGPTEGIPVRVHRSTVTTSRAAAHDVVGPWASAPFPLASRPCLQLELAHDLWSSEGAGVEPPAGPEEWQVTLEQAP